MADGTSQVSTPPDRYKMVYLIFLIHGIGVLMPWNMFITAIQYFNYKLSKEYIGYAYPYLPNFMQYLTFSSQVPNVLFNWMNIFVRIGGSLTPRIVWSITIEVIIFIVTILLAMFDSSEWPDGFFFVTMICVVILNMVNGIYQNTIFGMAAKLPFKYTGGIILGNNICGTFTSLVSLISKVVTSSNTRVAAIYYFITALFVLLVCFDTYFVLPLSRFYRYFDLKEKKDLQQRGEIKQQERPPYLDILKKSWMQFYNAFLVFFVTISLFPALQSNVKPNNEKCCIPAKYFTDVTCFITFNFFAMLGSLLPSFVIWPSPKWLWIPVTLRLFYIPFYLFCNYHVEGTKRTMKVLVRSDWVYWIVAATMAFTNGYFSSLSMMYAPGTVEERYASTAAMLAAAFLITGIFSGILMSFLWPWVIANA